MKSINKAFGSTLVSFMIITALAVAPLQYVLASTITFTCDAYIEADQAGIGSPATFTFTIKNTGSAKMGSANITIPAGYTNISTPTILSSPASQTWTVTLIVQPTFSTNGLIFLEGSGEGLSKSQSVSFTFAGVNPSIEGEFNWIVVANQNTGVGGNDYKVTTATAPIYILDHITISPSSATIVAGGSQSYNASGYGQNNYSFGDITDFVTWSINSGVGTYAWTDNSVQVTKSGEWTVTAHYGDKTATSTLLVTDAGINHFAVNAPTSVIAGSSFAINVTAEDRYNNLVANYAGTVHFTSSDPQAVLPGDSLASATGTFSVTLKTIRIQTVTATDKFDDMITGTSNDITVNENTALQQYVVVSPSTATVAAGDSQTFTVELFDVYGNNLGDVTNSVTWSIDSGNGTYTWTDNSVQVVKAGEWTVTAHYSDVPDALASLVVTGHLPDVVSIQVAPETWSMEAGSSNAFIATASDGYNSWDVTDLVTWSIDAAAGGSWVQSTGTYTSASTGTWTVVASLGNLFDTATLTVTTNADLLDHIVISPKTQTIGAGQNRSYSVEAFDQYGNDIGDVTSFAVLTAPNASVVGNVVTANLVGSYGVTASYSGLTDSATLTVSGYTMVFKQSGLPSGTSWSITFAGVVFFSTTDAISVSDLSAISYSWSTSNYIQAGQTRYEAAKTDGSVTVSDNLTQNIDYSTQYLVTYVVVGNVMPVSVPSDEWITSGGRATGSFLGQIGSIDGKANCIFVSDDRPSTITKPATITGTYRTQYLVVYAVVGNAIPVTVPSNEWVNMGAAAKGTFTPTITNSAYGRLRCILINDNRSLTINAPTTITANYRTQYEVIFELKDIESDATGTLLTTLGSARDYDQLPYATWVNNGTLLVFDFNETVASKTADKQYLLMDVNATSPMLIESPTMIQGTYRPQYSTRLYTVALSALLLFILLLLLILALVRRKRKKQKEENGNSLPPVNDP